MLSKPGIVKSASLDFHQFSSRSKLFNELKTILNECICMLHFPEPDHRIHALRQLHSLVCSLTKDNTTLSKSAFEATQLDEKLFIMENLCIFLKSHSSCHEASSEKKDLWARQTDLCLSIMQGVACFCPETTGYFLNISHLKILINIFSCKQPKVVLNALETIQIILGTSPEHLRAFENSGGIQQLSQIAKYKEGASEAEFSVTLKCVEFICLYLLPESDLGHKASGSPSIALRTVQEKEKFVSTHFGEDFVQRLQHLIPF